MLYRVFRYRASAASETAEKLFDSEFKHEEEDALSTYDVERECSVQTSVEHYAAGKCDPPRTVAGVDCSSLTWGTDPDDPGGPFKALRDAHRLVRTKSEADRITFAEDVWNMLKAGQDALVSVNKDEMRAYVHGRKQAADPEWLSFLESADADWQKYPKPMPPPAVAPGTQKKPLRGPVSTEDKPDG